jgi:hypothetical protein
MWDLGRPNATHAEEMLMKTNLPERLQATLHLQPANQMPMRKARLAVRMVLAMAAACCCCCGPLYAANPADHADPTLRLEAKDYGMVLKHGDGPDQCDAHGNRNCIAFAVNGRYYLHYDGTSATYAGVACLAISDDLIHWTKKGTVLSLGAPGEPDAGLAVSPWVYCDGGIWHMFYLGSRTPDLPTPTHPNLVISGYWTLKARSQSPAGPWTKQKDVMVLRPKPGTYYEWTASPGAVVKHGDEYLMFFSCSFRRDLKRTDPGVVMQTIGIARAKNLDGPWTVDPAPILPGGEHIENTSVYFEPTNKTWFLFVNHACDRVNRYIAWVYWTKDLNKWDASCKAVLLDGRNCTWSRNCVGFPSVVKAGNRLAVLYDGCAGQKNEQFNRDIGLAFLPLPLAPPSPKDGAHARQ